MRSLKPKRHAAALAISALALTLAACAPNPWREHFTVNPAAARAGLIDPSNIPRTTHGQPAAPEIRAIDPDRYARYLAKKRAERLETDTPDDNLSTAERKAAARPFLAALRIDQPPGAVALLGISRFTNTSFLGGPRYAASRFASSINADIAVIVTDPLGLRETVISEPVTTDFTARAFTPDRRQRKHDRHEDLIISGTETTYIPLVVEKPAYQHTAFYFARIDPALAAHHPDLLLPPPPTAPAGWAH